MGVNKRQIATVMLLAGLLASGCAAARVAGWEREAPVAGASASGENLAAAQRLWAERLDPARAREAAEAFAAAADAAPDDYAAQVGASRAYYWLGNSFYDTEDDETLATRQELFERGLSYGEKALAVDPKFREKVAAGAALEEAVAVLGPDRIAAIYWTASNLGKWSLAAGFTTMLVNKDRIRKLYERALALDEQWFYGAAWRSLAVVYAKAPAYAGGDPARSREFFEKSIAAGPNYFATRTLMAEFLAPTLAGEEGKKMFRDCLQYVIDTPADREPEIAPENVIEQKKAEQMLEHQDEYFIE